MALFARLLLFLLGPKKPTKTLTLMVSEQDPEEKADPDYLVHHLELLDDYGIENWIDFLEHCWSLDSAKHKHSRF